MWSRLNGSDAPRRRLPRFHVGGHGGKPPCCGARPRAARQSEPGFRQCLVGSRKPWRRRGHARRSSDTGWRRAAPRCARRYRAGARFRRSSRPAPGAAGRPALGASGWLGARSRPERAGDGLLSPAAGSIPRNAWSCRRTVSKSSTKSDAAVPSSTLRWPFGKPAASSRETSRPDLLAAALVEHQDRRLYFVQPVAQVSRAAFLEHRPSHRRRRRRLAPLRFRRGLPPPPTSPSSYGSRMPRTCPSPAR